MSDSVIHADSRVGAMMDAHPETIAVFLRRRMQCPGCVMAPFLTLAEVARSYAIDSEGLVDELRAAVPSAGAGGRS